MSLGRPPTVAELLAMTAQELCRELNDSSVDLWNAPCYRNEAKKARLFERFERCQAEITRRLVRAEAIERAVKGTLTTENTEDAEKTSRADVNPDLNPGWRSPTEEHPGPGGGGA